MKRAIRNNTGTTLLELVVALVILGTVAAGALAILTNVTAGMIQTRTESAVAENVQAALTRITHEIVNMDIKRAYSFGSSSITYYYRTDGAQSTIQLSGTTLQLNGNTLLNNVVAGTGFAVTAPTSTTPTGITITVLMVGPKSSVNKSFTTSIELNTQRFQ
jgi:type II secretory pathway pseudopilin PulG